MSYAEIFTQHTKCWHGTRLIHGTDNFGTCTHMDLKGMDLVVEKYDPYADMLSFSVHSGLRNTLAPPNGNRLNSLFLC